jgi:hypothetical protein
MGLAADTAELLVLGFVLPSAEVDFCISQTEKRVLGKRVTKKKTKQIDEKRPTHKKLDGNRLDHFFSYLIIIYIIIGKRIDSCPFVHVLFYFWYSNHQ